MKQNKRCWRCKELLPKSQFTKNRSRKDGLQDDCRACRAEAAKAWSKTTAGRAWRTSPSAKAYRKRRHEKLKRTKAGREYLRAVFARGRKKYVSKHPEIIQARTKVNHAIQRGRLERQNCHCGQPAEAHITDLKNPLEGIKWLCPLHNRGAKSGALGVARTPAA